jgi:Na+-translocating ferredoxin:NAD+ oxidoreductase RnfC subunit
MSSAVIQSRRASRPKGIPRLLAGARSERAATLQEHVERFGRLSAPRDLIAVLEDAGLCGRGGAAFPTAHKFRSVAAQRSRPVVVGNGAEGEPASNKDKALIRLAPTSFSTAHAGGPGRQGPRSDRRGCRHGEG